MDPGKRSLHPVPVVVPLAPANGAILFQGHLPSCGPEQHDGVVAHAISDSNIQVKHQVVILPVPPVTPL